MKAQRDQGSIIFFLMLAVRCTVTQGPLSDPHCALITLALSPTVAGQAPVPSVAHIMLKVNDSMPVHNYFTK